MKDGERLQLARQLVWALLEDEAGYRTQEARVRTGGSVRELTAQAKRVFFEESDQ